MWHLRKGRKSIERPTVALLSFDSIFESLVLAGFGAVPALLDPISFLQTFRSQSFRSRISVELSGNFSFSLHSKR